MFLYSLTLQRASAITCSIHGHFSGTKQQEIVVGHGKTLELLHVNSNTSKVTSLVCMEIFGVVRSLTAFRLTGGAKDYIVVGTDSGRIAILEYNPLKNTFERIHLETFGKSGSRRIVPGQYLTADPKGRAIMISAIEKQKLVYIMNRDSAARLTISSPLEAHKAHSILFASTGVDVGFENPLFACVELDYEDADNDSSGEAAQAALPSLVYYELDLGLNHVVRKSSEPLAAWANMLITVPGGDDGPGGLLICCEGFLQYKTPEDTSVDIRCPFPGRKNDISNPSKRGPGKGIVVAHSSHKTKTMFFFVVQLESGDLFKVTLDVDDDTVVRIRMKYFDTVPLATSMHILRSGYLFVASEKGDHHLYQISRLADNDDEPDFSSSGVYLNDHLLSESITSGGINLRAFVYPPRSARNIALVDVLESFAPITNCKVEDLTGEDTAQFYTLCGRGPRSTLRVLRHGLEVLPIVATDLPSNPTAIWSVKKSVHDQFDAYMVVSWLNATLVLAVGETVTEATDTGILATVPTLSISRLGEEDILQIYTDGIRHIRADKRVNEWKTPGRRQIVKAACNERQVAIALAGGEIVYFELDISGQLNEYSERFSSSSEVSALAIAPVPRDRRRGRFLAVAATDNTVRLVSLELADTLQSLSLQTLPTSASSLCFVEASADAQTNDLVLGIGLDNGVLLRTSVDPGSGTLTDTRTRYLGNRAVKLFPAVVRGLPGFIALSSRPWLFYSFNGATQLAPLSYDALDYASAFSSEQCPEGFVAIVGNTLHVLAVPNVGHVFNQASTPLKYTPRKLLVHNPSKLLIIAEGDHNTYSPSRKEAAKTQVLQESDEMVTQEEEELPEDVFGAPAAGEGQWSSCLRLLDPLQANTLDFHELEGNETVFSLSLCSFHGHENETFVIVGTAVDVNLQTRGSSGGFLRTYRLNAAAKKLELLHKTDIEGIPGALHPFQGRLLAGVGSTLRIYDLGKRKLLRKCENRALPNFIIGLNVMGGRILVSDVQESIHFMRYRPSENQLVVFADDSNPRWITCATMLDYDTVAAADKFGNLFVLRLPADISDDIDDDPSAGKVLALGRSFLNGASQKADTIVNFHVGDTITSLQKAVLVPGGPECLVYTTVLGGIGIMVPFTTQEDIDFFKHLELYLRQEHPPICGRDHLAFRSHYYPVKNVVDGDLCEQFNALDIGKRRQIGDEISRTPNEISKKLEDLRTRYAF